MCIDLFGTGNGLGNDIIPILSRYQIRKVQSTNRLRL